MLRDLIDETLQVQAARAADIKIDQKAVNQEYAQIAKRFGQSPASLGQFLTSRALRSGRSSGRSWVSWRGSSC
jgi:peptidyl-prolyl cis-trans isomerase SurA